MNTPLKLGEGSYGCVLKGNLVYSTNNLNNTVFLNSNGEVTKIMIDEKDYKKELLNTFTANKLDSSTSLIVHATSILDKNDIKNILNDKNNKDIIDKLGLCENIIDNLDNLQKIYQITYSKEGVIIDYLPKHIQNFNNIVLIELFYNLFHSLLIYKNNNFNHHDIKNNNIIFIPKNNKIVFIDYGLSCNTDDIDIERYYKYLCGDYNDMMPSQPPEIIACALLSKYKSGDAYLDEYISRYNYVTTKNINKLLIEYIYNNKENMKIELIKVFHNKSNYKITDSFTNLDTYKLCSVLADYIDFFKNIQIKEEYEKQFIEAFSRNLAKALQIDPDKRINIKPFLIEYTRLLTLYKKYKKT